MNTPKPFDPNKPCRYRNGEPARILCTDAPNPYNIVTITEKGVLYTHTADGSFYQQNLNSSQHDLVNIQEKKTIEFWVNVGKRGEIGNNHQTRDDADEVGGGRIACLHFVREYEEGEGL